MTYCIPQARTVRTIRWALTILFRLWALKFLTEALFLARSEFAEMMNTSFSMPNGESRARFDCSLWKAMIFFAPAAAFGVAIIVFAPRIARWASRCPTGARLAASACVVDRVRVTTPWWLTVVLRLWVVWLLAVSVTTFILTWSDRASYLIVIASVRGDDIDTSGKGYLARFWDEFCFSNDSSIWLTPLVAIALWILAPWIGKLFSGVSGASRETCVTCGYDATTPTCPECGTQLSPAASTPA